MKILIIIGIIVGVVLIWSTARIVFFAKRTGVLMKISIAFERIIPNAKMRILVLGDSTAVGTGATDQKDSTAGRLGSLYPEAEVINISENGLRIDGLLKKLEGISMDEHFDIVLIQIGANDIIRLTSIKDIDEGIKKVLERAKAFGGVTIVLHSGNVGESEFFPLIIRPLLSHRSKLVREIYINETKNSAATYIDLMNAPSVKEITDNPKRYYAYDYLHLNDEGYGLWFDEIKKYLPPPNSNI